jgi:ABC-type multidrug transport system fused ATPase/permease subunit
LVNLLLRFYDPQQGSILLDGTDIRQIAIRSLRKVIGVVDQHALMFDGTILKNIQFGNVQSTPDEIIRASRHSYADEFIARLPNGYETSVGERGVRLSAGQCQRIVLARAFLKNPDILVMDEAVSSIDSQSEQYIQQALIPLLRNRTTILVAHRLSSLMLADHVIVLDEGRVVEQGSHRQLVELNGHYAKLFQEQFEVEAKVEARPEGAVYV